MSNLSTYKFSKLYDFSSGISTKPEQAGHGSPFISFSTVFNNYFIPDILTDFMDTTEKEQITYSIKKGDILLTRTSETVDALAMSCVALEDYPQTTYSGFTKRLRPLQNNITYDKFMGFYLRSKLFRKTMTNNAVLTLRASLNEQIFSYLDLLLPEYNDQVKIGNLLYTLNQKIDINNSINKELESIAKTIYDYWFVQFNFPNENNKPYKSSAGKMIYNKKLNREIPYGWEDGILGDISKLVRGVSYDKNDIKVKDDKNIVPILRATNINGNVIDLENMVYVPKENVNSKQLIKKYEILITMSSGSKDHIGKNAFYYLDQVVSYGAFCAKIVPIKEFNFYVYSYTQSQFMFETIKHECLGTNINNLNNSIVNNFKLIIPDICVVRQFNKIVIPIYERIAINKKQNEELSKLRDWLLPMLMNGQVSVK